jgi:hypothetical protein
MDDPLAASGTYKSPAVTTAPEKPDLRNAPQATTTHPVPESPVTERPTTPDDGTEVSTSRPGSGAPGQPLVLTLSNLSWPPQRQPRADRADRAPAPEAAVAQSSNVGPVGESVATRNGEGDDRAHSVDATECLETLHSATQSLEEALRRFVE